jgi:hypothetical protein
MNRIRVNYATSYEARKNVRLGFSGYWLQQMADHRINKIDVPCAYMETNVRYEDRVRPRK